MAEISRLVRRVVPNANSKHVMMMQVRLTLASCWQSVRMRT